MAAWRTWGLSAAGGARRNAEETVAVAVAAAATRGRFKEGGDEEGGDGDGEDGVDFLSFARALRTVVHRHMLRVRLAAASMIHAEGDARGALHAYRAALGITPAASRGRRLAWAPAEALLRAARLTKQLARSTADLKTAEMLLRAAAAAAVITQAVAPNSTSTSGTGAGTAAAAEEGSRRVDESGRAARSDLGMLLCQEGRDANAAGVLSSMGFRYRLARDVLRYPVTDDNASNDSSGSGRCSASAKCGDIGKKVAGGQRTGVAGAAAPAVGEYVRAFDGAVPESMLRHLRAVFGARSPFWMQHGYHREGNGFFSYVHSLQDLGPGGAQGAGAAGDTGSIAIPGGYGGGGDGGYESTMDAVVRHVWKVAAKAFPAAKAATRAEWWAHCRPHASGHQVSAAKPLSPKTEAQILIP
jgi:hypothetical protein